MAKMNRYLPLREYRGNNKDGTVKYHECYGDPRTFEVHKPRDEEGNLIGWKGDPPDQPSGSMEKEVTERIDRDAFRVNYQLIDWGHKEKNDG